MKPVPERRWTQFYQTVPRFATVGVINTLLTVSVIFILKSGFGVRDVSANALGYIVGFICSFILNRRWTFGHSGNYLAALARFIFVFLVSYLANIIAVLAVLFLGMNDYLAHIFGMPIYTAIFYFGCNHFVFTSQSSRLH